jgi:hypothetical protein
VGATTTLGGEFGIEQNFPPPTLLDIYRYGRIIGEVSPNDLAEYLRANPKATPVLRAALEEETSHAGQPTYLGWEWYEVRAYPATLVKLVVDGLISVNFKSNSSTCYLLRDAESIKRQLGDSSGT